MNFGLVQTIFLMVVKQLFMFWNNHSACDRKLKRNYSTTHTQTHTYTYTHINTHIHTCTHTHTHIHINVLIHWHMDSDTCKIFAI